MEQKISHNISDEAIESKTRWFRSLLLNERMELLCEFTDFILTGNPTLLEKKDAQSLAGRIQVLTKS